MSVLSKEIIKREIAKGNITITPFHEKALTPNGYDLHLGKNICILTSPSIDVKREVEYKFDEIPPNGILFMPNKVYLGVTVEHTSCFELLPVMEGKSSLGRMGIEAHICAGFGDIGFSGHWTLEIRVTVPTRLYPNMAIGQLIWHTIKKTRKKEEGYDKLGSYNNKPSENPFPIVPNFHKKDVFI